MSSTERVTSFFVRDVDLPGGAGTLALITMDNGLDHTKPTTFGQGGLANLAAALDTVSARAEAGQIVAVAITGKPFVFAVGADLTQVGAVSSREQALAVGRSGHQQFRRLGDLPVPSFAFINGAAMGGGLEIALHARYRSVSAGVPAVALPEVFLGLVPGWGGAYLLPNLAGPVTALKVIVENPLNQNRTLTGPQAARLGLADVMLEPADFLSQSLRWAAAVVTGAAEVARPPVDRDEALWENAISQAQVAARARTGGAAPAVDRALELIRGARTADRDAGFAAEDEALADLVMSEEFRAGLYAFNLVRRGASRPASGTSGATAATPDRSGEQQSARPVTKVGVVGAGLMAGQLALLLVRRLKVPVLLTDLDADRVAKGVRYVHGEIDALLAKGRVGADPANRLKALVTGSTSKAGFADADLVIEAVFEELTVKQQVFAEVEAVVSPQCVLASNTSSLSIDAMAAGLRHPERVVGLHFFNPVSVMPLLEVVQGRQTDPTALSTALAVAKALKKTAVLVQDSPSFVVNRLLGRFMGEVARMVDQGTPVEVADRACAGLAPMPPFVLIGLVGPPIALHNSRSLAAAFPDRFAVSPLLERVVAAGRPGYYLWDGSTPRIDPEVAALVEPPTDPVELSVPQVRERVLAVLADEARRMLDEGVVAGPDEIDLAMITGAGFSFWNGGLTPLLDRTGAAERSGGGRFLPPGVAGLGAPDGRHAP
jgi:3-hydroxyacyl-CoA dehydrogenase/enoyl-CoA hydratase/carnithine racemase